MSDSCTVCGKEFEQGARVSYKEGHLVHADCLVGNPDIAEFTELSTGSKE